MPPLCFFSWPLARGQPLLEFLQSPVVDFAAVLNTPAAAAAAAGLADAVGTALGGADGADGADAVPAIVDVGLGASVGHADELATHAAAGDG